MRFLRWLNIWSIDVAVAAGLLSMALAHIWNIAMPVAVPVLLGISVWIIYTFDHIKDAFETNAPGYSMRRLKHRRYFQVLITAAVFLLLLAGTIIFFVPPAVIVNGSALGCLVGAYFISLHYLGRRFSLPKEVVIAVLYTAGIALGPLSVGNPPPIFRIHLLQLFLLALNNLLLFSWFDREADEKEGFHGLVQSVRPERMRRWLMLIVFTEIMLSAFLMINGLYPFFEGIWLVMSVLMAIPLLYPGFWSENYRFRVAGDLIFLLPSFMMLFPHAI